MVAQPIDARYKALARALNVRVIELPGAAGRGRLEKQHVIRLRQALHECCRCPLLQQGGKDYADALGADGRRFVRPPL